LLELRSEDYSTDAPTLLKTATGIPKARSMSLESYASGAMCACASVYNSADLTLWISRMWADGAQDGLEDVSERLTDWPVKPRNGRT
jgi:hypothetical protein